MKAIKKWFAEESSESSNASEESSSEEEEVWEEKVARRERNKMRRRKNKENRMNKERITATKAALILGLQPIFSKDIEEHNKITKDLKVARKLAVYDYLRDFLQFNTEELNEVKIEDTKPSAKGDNTVYVAFANIEAIKDINWRVAQIRDKRVSIRNYIPPQFFERYMYINRECSAYRREYPEIKTQLRFGQRDVEILCKKRGSEEPYRTVSLDTITDPKRVPGFDHNMTWKQQEERAPRRQLIRASSNSNSNGMDVDKSTGHSYLNGLLRQSSTIMQSDKNKKQKLSATSSGSSSGSGSGQETE